jgi:hypothetical protein
MNHYRPPNKAQKQEDLVLRVRKQIAAEVRAANPHLTAAETEALVVHRLQHGPPPSPPGIPKEVLEARRQERRVIVARGKSARVGDKRPGRWSRERKSG